MKTIHVPEVFAVLGIFTTFFGVFELNWYGTYMIGLGISWLASGLILYFSKRKVTEGGLISALILGVIGSIMWVAIDISRNQTLHIDQSEGESEDLVHLETKSNLLIIILFLLCFVLYRAHFVIEDGLVSVSSMLLTVPLIFVLLFTRYRQLYSKI